MHINLSYFYYEIHYYLNLTNPPLLTRFHRIINDFFKTIQMFIKGKIIYILPVPAKDY